MSDYPKYEHLYGKRVKMNDRFETEHIWSEELAIRNNGRWIPLEIQQIMEKYNLYQTTIYDTWNVPFPVLISALNPEEANKIALDQNNGLTKKPKPVKLVSLTESKVQFYINLQDMGNYKIVDGEMSLTIENSDHTVYLLVSDDVAEAGYEMNEKELTSTIEALQASLKRVFNK